VSIAEEIVGAVFAAIGDAVALTEADRAKAHAAVSAKLDEIAAHDRGPLGPRADAVRARYLIRGGPTTPDDLPAPHLNFPLRDDEA
jgi:hypothetical protein